MNSFEAGSNIQIELMVKAFVKNSYNIMFLSEDRKIVYSPT